MAVAVTEAGIAANRQQATPGACSGDSDIQVTTAVRWARVQSLGFLQPTREGRLLKEPLEEKKRGINETDL